MTPELHALALEVCRGATVGPVSTPCPKCVALVEDLAREIRGGGIEKLRAVLGVEASRAHSRPAAD